MTPFVLTFVTLTPLLQGGLELAKRRGIETVVAEAYPRNTADFSAILARIKAADPDVVAAITYFENSVVITRQMRALDIKPRMYAVTVGSNLPKFYEQLGRSAEFVYGPSQWEPELVSLRAGGIVPIAREYAAAREFVASYRKEFPHADLSYQTAQGYGACQILLEGTRRAGLLDGEKIRVTIVAMDLYTSFGRFKVDKDGVQVGHRMLIFQWQDGKKAIVWPEDFAANGPRFPTPEWSKRP